MGKYILDPTDNSNYIKCTNFIRNCDLCNNEKCILCNKNYIFINDNFSECILKDSIDIDFYYTNDNINYYSCKDNKYKDKEICKALLKKRIQGISRAIPKIISGSNLVKKITYLKGKNSLKHDNIYNIFAIRILSSKKNEISSLEIGNTSYREIIDDRPTDLNEDLFIKDSSIPTIKMVKDISKTSEDLFIKDSGIPSTKIIKDVQKNSEDLFIKDSGIPTNKIIKDLTNKSEDLFIQDSGISS